jgi:cytochrome c oxidase subunit 3
MAQPAVVLGAQVERPSMVRVGTIVWLASELMFFAGLFAAYFTIRASVDPWPPEGVELETLQAGLFTVLLVASSGTMQLAHRAAERRRLRPTRGWLAATLALGTVFMAGQAIEYAANDFTIGSHAYGSIYYLMTGLHGLHVIGGLAAMLMLLLRTSVDRTLRDQEPGVAVVSYYWHFVDVVWLGLFATLYLVR